MSMSSALYLGVRMQGRIYGVKCAGHNTSLPALRFPFTRLKTEYSWRVVTWMIFGDCGGGGHTQSLWGDEGYVPS